VQELEQKYEEYQQPYQALERIVNEAVQGTVVLNNGGNHDQNTAPSSFGRKGIQFFIGAALALLLVIGVILGVTIPLTTNNKESPFESFPSEILSSDLQSPAPSPSPLTLPTSSSTPPRLTPTPTIVPTLALEPGVMDQPAVEPVIPPHQCCFSI
jgi:hypothetical protein